MHHHLTALADLFIALIIAGLASFTNDVIIHFPDMPHYLHLCLQASKGFMYLGSGVAGFVGGYKVIKSWFEIKQANKKDTNEPNRPN